MSSYYDFVASNLNRLWWDPADGAIPNNLTLTTSIVVGAKLQDTSISSLTKVETSPLLPSNGTDSYLKSVVASEYQTLWDTCSITQEGVGIINKGSIEDTVNKVTLPDEDDLTPDDPWLSTLARYALLSNDLTCTVKNHSVGSSKFKNRYYRTNIFDIEIAYKEFTTNDDIVQLIAADLHRTYRTLSYSNANLSYPNGYLTKYAITSMDFSDLEDDPDLVTRSYRLYENESSLPGNLDNIWINLNNTWYIKADAFTNPRAYGTTHKELYSYVISAIDSGYQKKKEKWWKKALAITIAVIVIYFVPGGAAIVKGAFSSLAGFALFVTAVSLTLTLLTLAFTVLGYADMASAFAAANKAIEPLALLASIYMIYTQFAKKAAEQGAKEAAKDYLENFVQNFTDDIIQGAKDVFAGKVTELSLNFTTKALQLVNLGASLRLEQIKDRNKDLKAEYEKAMEEATQENDILAGFARIYGKPATADWSMYAEQFDLPYERGGGPLHIGNIQRTTKQALRKADYSDPVFDNTLVV